MANLKLVEYVETSKSYTFPYNPNSVEFVTNKFMDRRNLPYSFVFMGFTNPIKSTIDINLNGHFDGTTKNSDYRSLVEKINKPILLKLYFENTYSKFYLCTGASVQKVPTGNRPLHLDYVANFFSPFGLLFSDTQKDGSSSSTNKNVGDFVTPIEKITGNVTAGQLVQIGDINGNGFKFTASHTGVMTYNIIKIRTEDNVSYLTEYGYVEILSGGINYPQAILNYSNTGDLFLKLESDQSLNNIFNGGVNISNITPTFYFRDGWSSD